MDEPKFDQREKMKVSKGAIWTCKKKSDIPQSVEVYKSNSGT